MKQLFPFQFLLLNVLIATAVIAQSPYGTISGLVLDPAARPIARAEIQIVNDATGVRYSGVTNEEGIYAIATLPPGPYRLQVSKTGFKTLIKPDIILNVQDALAINFTLPIGALSETVTVEGGATVVNTESAAVSTVVDRHFAENLPMNGRSFQTLIELTPGVVLTAYDNHDNGQFSVNGQRAAANYWMVDGVGANVGIGTHLFSAGNGIGGAVPTFSVLGGTNSLVSVDAMQEFRIQTSTYAPEFGRTPGGQVSIVTRSGVNQFHATAFNYFRNDVLDANDWFADRNRLPKPQERQNDFGGVLGGPLVRDRTFFFFSYEGLRLRLPQVGQQSVPDLASRQNATAAMQPFLNAYPLPTPGGVDDPTTGIAQFNASYSNRATLDAYSLRLDHRLHDKLSLFARYSYSPSSSVARATGSGNLSSVVPAKITTQSATVGGTWLLSPTIFDDLRFNFSKTVSRSFAYLDGFGGAIPLKALPFPAAFTERNSQLFSFIFPIHAAVALGPQGDNEQRQINFVDTVSMQRGSHALKIGADFRRLAPIFGTPDYVQEPLFQNVAAASAGNSLLTLVFSGRSGALLLHNLGLYAQDTWRATRSLTLTYGVRWDLDAAPSSSIPLPAVTGFDLRDLSHLALAAPGTAPFKTTYGNFAPRLGVAYQLVPSQNWPTVLRGGFGAFYDMATSEVGNAVQFGVYPFGATNYLFGSSFPLSASESQPPPITAASLSSSTLLSFDPALKLPYTWQWNLALEQGLGAQQTLGFSYVGSAGRRLLQTVDVFSPNANLAEVQLVTNAASSNYNALQVQFQRRLSHNLQALASYTWSHSIDTASAGSLYGNQANDLVPGIDPNQNRGSSDFDLRQAFSAAITYGIPVGSQNVIVRAIASGWSIQNVVQARSAPPVNVYDFAFTGLASGVTTAVRPDVVPGQPWYVYGSRYPGRKSLNAGAFTEPPLDANGNPLRQGNLPRNALRAFGAAQWDLAVHREFPIRERAKLQFRGEMFNILNHPNFAPPVSDLSDQSQFGQSVETLGHFLAGSSIGSGGFNALYQIGGSRSIQLALKLEF